MGTIWINGEFRTATKPVKIVSGNYSRSEKPSIALENNTLSNLISSKDLNLENNKTL